MPIAKICSISKLDLACMFTLSTGCKVMGVECWVLGANLGKGFAQRLIRESLFKSFFGSGVSTVPLDESCRAHKNAFMSRLALIDT